MWVVPDAPFSVIRVQVERLPNKELPPRPLWLAWIGGPLPTDLSVLWRWYLRRFTVEHAFRFFKQTLGSTTVRPRHAAAADRWNWLIAGACWRLLAIVVVPSTRGRGSSLWEHPPPDGLLTPRPGASPLHRIWSGSVLLRARRRTAPTIRPSSRPTAHTETTNPTWSVSDA